ncbi:unnamed protein product [Plutella xylostella]|uniref:2'-phosphotransferase n=1 Tax=Plutella xylostella TaxID=51655 RepID=A0A8S4DM16_PLUXY|nr:unnamed protein product [Plutella xylostella]
MTVSEYPISKIMRSLNLLLRPSFCSMSNKSDIKLSKALSWILRHGAVKEDLTLSPEGYTPVANLLQHRLFKGQYKITDIQRVVETNDKQRFKLRVNPLTHALEIRANQGHSLNGVSEGLTPILEVPKVPKVHKVSKVAKVAKVPKEPKVPKVAKVPKVPKVPKVTKVAKVPKLPTMPKVPQVAKVPNMPKVPQVPKGPQVPKVAKVAKVPKVPKVPKVAKAKYPTVVHGTYLNSYQSLKKEGLSRMSRQHIHFAKGTPGDKTVISGLRRDAEVFIYLDLQKALDDGLKFFESENGVILTAGNKDGYILPKYFLKVTSNTGKN